MKLAYGEIKFEKGDRLNIEDSIGKLTLTAKQGHNCGDCYFCNVCNVMNSRNVIARFCRETHFEEVKNESER